MTIQPVDPFDPDRVRHYKNEANLDLEEFRRVEREAADAWIAHHALNARRVEARNALAVVRRDSIGEVWDVIRVVLRAVNNSRAGQELRQLARSDMQGAMKRCVLLATQAGADDRVLDQFNRLRRPLVQEAKLVAEVERLENQSAFGREVGQEMVQLRDALFEDLKKGGELPHDYQIDRGRLPHSNAGGAVVGGGN